MEEILKKVYYDPKNEAGFSSAQRLYVHAKKIYPSLKFSDVKDWLRGQLAYTLHHPARRRWTRNKIIVEEKDEQWEADLVDMQEFSRFNSGYKYIITLVDVFSKYAYAIPIKSKSAKDMSEALLKLFREHTPEQLRTDQGLEFRNSAVQTVLKDLSIQYFTTKEDTIKCAVVERFNRTLKGRMYKYFTSKGTRRWMDVLDKLVYAYNHAWHSSIKMAPIAVNDANKQKVFEALYGYKNMRELLMAKHSKKLFKVGDKVRLKYKLSVFDKSYYPNWSDNIYEIINITTYQSKPFYILKDQQQNILPRRFYAEDLQKVNENYYRVDKILKRQRREGELQYYVSWIGYPSSYNSWIKASTNSVRMPAGTRREYNIYFIAQIVIIFVVMCTALYNLTFNEE